MQQTEKFQFKLIESSDPFSVQPLNDNMAKVETALADHRTQVSAALSAQAAAVAALPRVVSGSYTGTGDYGADHPTVLEVPDAERPPSVILVSDSQGYYQAMMIRGMTHCTVYTYMYDQIIIDLTWTDKGVRWYNKDSSGKQLNYPNDVYGYAVFI